MLKYAVILFFLFSVNSSFCQYKIVDSKTKEPVSFSHVKVINQPKGEIANYYGVFYLDSTYNISDTLNISCIGYEDRYVTLSNLKVNNIVELLAKTQNLQVVEVKAEKVKCKLRKLGVRKKPKTMFVDYSITANNGVERATWIPNEYSVVGYLKLINIFITNYGFPDAHFRIHVYECSHFETKPGKELTTSNIIASGTTGNEWVTINMEEHYIEVPENGCFIGVEWFDSPKSKYFKDTLKWKSSIYQNGEMRDTTYSHIRKGNGVVLGSILEKYKFAKNKRWYRNSSSEAWINTCTEVPIEWKFNIPDTSDNGDIYIINESNCYPQIPCINIEVSFVKAKIKTEYDLPKKRKLNKIVKVKEDLFKYPQSNISELFSSIIKAVENNDIIYVFKFLCVYKDGNLKEILKYIHENVENSGEVISDNDKATIINHFKEIQQQLNSSALSKLSPKNFVLKVNNEFSYHLIVEDGLWRIYPYTYKIYNDPSNGSNCYE